jgi:UDP-glucose 4-epimerase
MKIVITGGNGYIGARLSQYLATKGEQVIPVCFPSIPEDEAWRNKMFAILKGDLRQDETIAEIAELKPDVIIHLVSLDHFDSEKEPGFVNDINVLPTWRLLNACTKIGLKKFIYFSTIQVYGKLPNSIIDESQPAKPANTYGLTHLLSEQICDHYNRKTATNVISIRLSNSYGDPVFNENNCWWLAINDLCKNAYTNKEIRLLSDGTPQRDFIHGNDVCQAIKKIIEYEPKKIESNIYHISSALTLTLMEIAKIVKNVYQNRYNQKLPILTPNKIISEDEIISKSEKYQISNNKIREIGFTPQYDLNKGINDLFNYLEKNHDNI